MPHVLRRTLLLSGLSLLLLAPSPASTQAPARTKSPGPRTLSFPVDPAQLTPQQRLKLEQAALAATPAAAAALSPAPASRLRTRVPGPTAAPVAVSPAERAVLAARSQAKLEIYQRGPSPRPNQGRPAMTQPRAPKPASRTPRVAPNAASGPPGLTPAERAKAEAAGIRLPASDGVQR
jgi:hypothetical protein